MGLEEKGGAGISGILAERELQSLKDAEFNKKLEAMGQEISQMGKNVDKMFLGIKGLGEADGKTTILDFNIQQCWDRIKTSERGYEDMDKIFAGRFANNPEFRKQALDKLSDEKVIEMVKNKELDGILTGVCRDEACRADLTARVKQAQKGTDKKLL